MDKTIKYLLVAASALTLAGCSNEDINNDTLEGNGVKTKLDIEASLGVKTRAVNKEFEENDVLLTYLRHVKGSAKGSYTSIAADQAPRLVALTYNGGTLVDVNADTKGTDDLTVEGGLYWDDFSSSNSAETDLRTSGHALQSFYGYCYNGGTPTNPLTEETGVLGWTASNNQTGGIKSYDLLWSEEQEAVEYAHADKNVGGDHRTITIPYTHAMSKITINLVAGEGFKEGAFANTLTSIVNFNNVGIFTAPTGDVEETASANIAMYKNAPTTMYSKPFCMFEAMTVPHTNLSIGNTLATVTDVDGNNYSIPVTKGIIEAWEGKLTESVEIIDNGVAQAKPLTRAGIDKGKGWITEPGVNYVLTVTLNKTEIKVCATIKDWDYVYAEGVGEIKFTNDVKDKGTIDNALKAGGFDVYKSSSASSFPEKSTSVTFDADKWTYNKTIYWQNASDDSYFRALSPSGTVAANITQGTDVLWGTSGNEAIKPRTGDVHLDFKHAMSKITMQLATTNDASMVDLTDAKISISNLSAKGSINIVDGTVTAKPDDQTGIAQTLAPITDYAVIPQNLTASSIITITLKDGTVYKLKLTDCLASGSEDHITKWVSGNHYTYTITLSKEAVTFRALVKQWDETSGNGNATLEWD